MDVRKLKMNDTFNEYFVLSTAWSNITQTKNNSQPQWYGISGVATCYVGVWTTVSNF